MQNKCPPPPPHPTSTTLRISKDHVATRRRESNEASTFMSVRLTSKHRIEMQELGLPRRNLCNNAFCAYSAFHAHHKRDELPAFNTRCKFTHTKKKTPRCTEQTMTHFVGNTSRPYTRHGLCPDSASRLASGEREA